MTAPPPLPKTLMLERSLGCFVLGLFGLVPVFGLPAGVAALVLSARVRADHRGVWNAAQPYLVAGRVLAMLGVLLTGGIGIFFVAALMDLL